MQIETSYLNIKMEAYLKGNKGTYRNQLESKINCW